MKKKKTVIKGQKNRPPRRAPVPAPQVPPSAGGGTGGKPPLSATPDEIRDAADAVAVMRGQLGGPDVTVTRKADLQVVYDPLAEIKAKRVATALRRQPDIATASGVTPERLLSRAQQYESAYCFRRTAELASGALDDTRAIVQRKGLRMAARLVQRTQAAIAALPPGDPARIKLEGKAARMLDLWNKIKQSAVQKGATTKDKNKAHKDALGQVKNKTRLAHTVGRIAEGQPVSPADEAAVLDTVVLKQQGEGAPAQRAQPAGHSTPKTRRTPRTKNKPTLH